VEDTKMAKVKGYKDLPKSAVVTWTISVILCLIGLGLMFLDMANIFVTKTYIQLAFILVGQFINIFNIIKYKEHIQK
jgi:FtsH-binding integral membrane protein